MYIPVNVLGVAMGQIISRRSLIVQSHRYLARPLFAMSASGKQGEDGAISNYLNRNVDAVALPEKTGRYREDSTYPPLIIDGASGTGKTQQAFALVKEHKTIIYFLMSDPPEGDLVREQRIYASMRSLTLDYNKSRFASRVDEAIKALRENERNKEGDICSVNFLNRQINGAKSTKISYDPIRKRWDRDAESAVKGLDQLVDVVDWMCSKRIQWDGDSGLSVDPIQPEGKTSCKFRELYSQLKDSILFLDEALPKRGPDMGGIDRFRFVRNLGRALTMRLVLAGTGATAANLILEPPGELAWIECQFLWKTMSDENDVKRLVLPNLASPSDSQRAVISELARSRPYLVDLFGEVMNCHYINSDDLAEVLYNVGTELRRGKSMSDESRLVYLTGVFLDQRHTSRGLFHVKPAELVRGNYFEPCVVLDVEGNPACGLSWGVSSLASGHLRIKIYRYDYSRKERTMWCASMKDTNFSKPRAAFCWDFSGIQYSLLGACVQQCLAREPLLAVALSTQCRMFKKEFREALSKLHQEPRKERTVDSADGEHMLFAQLQLASNYHKLREARVELVTFLREIADYWNDCYGSSFADGVADICRQVDNLERGPSQVRLDAMSGTHGSDLKIDDQTNKDEKYTLPWLVPACSLEDLKKTVEGAPLLFDGIDIAGLVPGDRNAAFNAAAYSWKNLAMEPAWEFKDVSPPEWVFAFRARASPRYTTDEALKELKSKCLMQQEMVEHEQSECLRQRGTPEDEPAIKKGRWVSDHGQPDKLHCHAMLVAATGGPENSCEIVYSDDGTGKYLRVALILGLGRKYLW